MADSDALIGQIVSHYRIVEKLGDQIVRILEYLSPTHTQQYASPRRSCEGPS